MTWNPLALATALQTVPEQNIDVTNSESALIIKMNDYGDLQINILFTSRQMIIETFICPVSSISNPDDRTSPSPGTLGNSKHIGIQAIFNNQIPLIVNQRRTAYPTGNLAAGHLRPEKHPQVYRHGAE